MKRTTQNQAMWFLVVGAAATLVHFAVLVFCVQFANIDPVWANVIAFFVAFCVSFIGHFSLTFRQVDKSISWQQSLIKWFISSITGFLFNQSLFMLGLKLFGNKWYVFIWVVVTALVTIVTFALGKLWAFKQ